MAIINCIFLIVIPYINSQLNDPLNFSSFNTTTLPFSPDQNISLQFSLSLIATGDKWNCNLTGNLLSLGQAIISQINPGNVTDSSVFSSINNGLTWPGAPTINCEYKSSGNQASPTSTLYSYNPQTTNFTVSMVPKRSNGSMIKFIWYSFVVVLTLILV